MGSPKDNPNRSYNTNANQQAKPPSAPPAKEPELDQPAPPVQEPEIEKPVPPPVKEPEPIPPVKEAEPEKPVPPPVKDAEPEKPEPPPVKEAKPEKPVPPPLKEPEPKKTVPPPVKEPEPAKVAPPSVKEPEPDKGELPNYVKKERKNSKYNIKEDKNKPPIKEEEIKAPITEETNEASIKEETKPIPSTYTPPKPETIEHDDSESRGALVMFMLETECKLYGVYQIIRETTPLNIITFYGLLLYIVYKVLGGLFGGSGVNGNVNFTYKVVDESAQAAILQHIDSAVQQPGSTSQSGSGLAAPAAPRELLSSIADLTAKLNRLDQIESSLFSVQDSVKQVYSAQQEFQNEICESHQDIWNQLHALTGDDATPIPTEESLSGDQPEDIIIEQMVEVQPEQPTVLVEQEKEEIGPVELQIEAPEIRPPVIEEKAMKAPPVYEEKLEPPPLFEDPLEQPPVV